MQNLVDLLELNLAITRVSIYPRITNSYLQLTR